MKRLLHAILGVVSSRALAPLVIGFFFLLYIGIAFFTDETLITLMAFTRNSRILAGILALIPLNFASRIVREALRQVAMHRALTGKPTDGMSELFDETVELQAAPPLQELESRLAAEGYKTRRSENALATWRGISMFPARILFLTATFCLFTGILISITTRTSHRQMVIEGEPLPMLEGIGGLVERITLANSSGSILRKTLAMEVAPSGSGYGKRIFGIYPPSLYGGAFVYPRYLGLALLLRFNASDLPIGLEIPCTLNIYPPGKEAVAAIPGSPYRIRFSLVNPDDGTNPYMTGRMVFRFKVLKDKEAIFSGTAPSGGEFAYENYRIALPDARRLVITDFVGDSGVYLIWTAGMLFLVAAGAWLPVRFIFPRREMLFVCGPDAVNAGSRAEGKVRRHAGIFHEALDFLEVKKPGR